MYRPPIRRIIGRFDADGQGELVFVEVYGFIGAPPVVDHVGGDEGAGGWEEEVAAGAAVC